MPNWKKLIVSGSAGSLSSLTVDNNISANSISSSGAITGSDTYIDDWGSVSASLASISSSAISIPTLQQVTEQGSSTDQQINITGALTASGLIYPTADGSDKEVLVTDGSGNLTFERPNVYANVKNKSGATLLKGTPVHASSSVGNLAEVIAASASVASTMPATFILNEDLADEAEGLAVVTGFLNGVDTSAFSEGDIVYVGASGGYTNVKPSGSSNLIQNLGIVINVDASNGSGFIYGSGRSNDIPNLPTGKVWVGSDEYSVTSSVVHLDETNERLGIGTTTPQDTLHVEGNITGSGNITIAEHNLISSQNDRLRILTNLTGSQRNINFYANRTGSYSSATSTFSFINQLGLDTTGSSALGYQNSFYNRLHAKGNSRYDDLVAISNNVRVDGDNNAGDQIRAISNFTNIEGSGTVTNGTIFNVLSHVVIDNPNSTVGKIVNLHSANTLTAGSASRYYGLDFNQNVNANYHISGDYALIYSDETTVPTVGGSTYNIHLPAAMESYLGGDLNIGQAISASGAITGSDVQIDDWGSVSASLASINASGYVDGTGAANKVAFWTDTDTISNDTNLHWDSSNDRLGIGTSTPSYTLDVSGSGNFTDGLTVTGSINHDGDLTVTGTVTAQEFHTEFVSSSIIYESGSTKFGDTLDDNHDFTGSLNISGSINLPDNVKARFGNNYDLDIFHAGSDSYIDNKTGTLIIQNSLDDSDVSFRSDDGSGGVTEYFKLDGSETQIRAAVDFRALDNVKIQAGTGGDLDIYHNGTSGTIDEATGDLTIQNSANDKDIIFKSDDGSGGVTEYFKLDGSQTQTIFSQNGQFQDNVRLKLGSGGDLQILHTGTASTISNSTGTLTITNSADDEDILFRTDDGSGGVTDYLRLDGSTTNAYFSNPGNVGIGTTTPQDTLHVEGNITGSGNLTISDHSYANNNNNRLRITPNYEKSSGVETGIYLYGNRTGSYSSNVYTYHFANDLRVDVTGSAAGGSGHINQFNRLTLTGTSDFDDLWGTWNQVKVNGTGNSGDQIQTFANLFELTGTGEQTTGVIYGIRNQVDINNPDATSDDVVNIYARGGLTAGTASAYSGIDLQQSVSSDFIITGDYALIRSNETATPTVLGNSYNIYLPAAIESYLGGDLNIGQAISASGAITGSDVQIDDWGSVSASLASINASAGTVDGSGAANKVAFWTDADTLSNDTDLHWDSTNDRLGINQSSPSYTLDVNGDANIQSGELRMTNGQNIRFGGAQAFAANSGTGQVTISSHGSLTDTTINSNLGVSGSLEISGSATLEGDLTVTGTVTAQEFHTEFVSASIIYQSGSTKFGDDINDVHNFTGSINLSGSIDLTGDILLDRVNESKIAFGIAGDMYGFNSANNVYLQKPGSSGGFNFSTQGHSFQIFTGTTAENVTLQTGTTPGLSVHSTGGLRYTQHAATNNNSGYVLTYTNGTAGNGERGKVEIAGDLTIEDYSSGTAVEAANIKNNGDAYFSGSVGIGATNPNQKLHVEEDLGTGGTLVEFKNSNSTYQQQLTLAFDDNKDVTFNQGSSAGGTIFDTGTRGHSFAVNGTTNIVFTGDGDVGIGTTSPDSKLEVAGDIHLSGNNTNRLDLDADVKITGQYNGNAGSELTYLNMYNGGNASINMGTKHSNGFISFESGDGAYTERMRITNSGNVGIGTETPAEKLDVYGNIRIHTGNELRFNNANVGAYRDSNDLRLAGYSSIQFLSSPTSMGSQTERMRITNAGRVGIGTTSPAYKLDLVGDLRVLSSSISYQENTDVDTGTETIATVNTGSFDGAFFDYLIKSGSNLRAGTVTAVHDGTNVEYNEVSTQDLGSTSVVELSVDISGADMRLRATTTSNDWLIKSLVRTL